MLIDSLAQGHPETLPREWKESFGKALLVGVRSSDESPRATKQCTPWYTSPVEMGHTGHRTRGRCEGCGPMPPCWARTPRHRGLRIRRPVHVRIEVNVEAIVGSTSHRGGARG